MPTAFRAITLITYRVPLVRPVTVHAVAVIGKPGLYRVQLAPLLLEYFTRYSVIAEPPVFAGAVHETARPALPLVATTDVGLSGTEAGVAGAEFADGRLMPTAFLAITLITYGVPLVRPVTVHARAVIGSLGDGKKRVHDPATPPLLEYFTIYSVIADPPLLAGATHVTPRLVLPLVATTDVGLSGTVTAGVAGAEFADGRLMPRAFRAMTLITYAVPLAKPVTVHDVAVIGELGLYRVHDPAAPLLLEYFTIYSMIFESPSLVGATHVTPKLVLPLVATTDVGLLGKVITRKVTSLPVPPT